jgi:CheY-like chemotaxis protein
MLAARPADPTRAPAEAAAAPCLLVVDDDPLSRSLQARLVALLGYRACVADGAADALARALDDGIDGMLLDLGMPEVDGFALLARLRAAEEAAARRPLPVIAVTGYAAALDRVRCLMAGFSDHLSKPVDALALGEVLARTLQVEARPASTSDAARVQAAARRLARAKPADARFAPTMLETFALRSGQLIEEIAAAARRGDADALSQAARALRNSAEFMGASSLAGLCDRLQRAARSADPSRAALLIDSLAEEHQTVLAVLLRAARDPAPR